MSRSSSSAPPRGGALPTSAALAPPPRRRLLRFGVPAVVVAGMAGLLAVSAGDSFRRVPSVPVHAVTFDPARPDAMLASWTQEASEAGSARGDGGRFAGARGTRGSSVQAPGWLEADPFLIACTALADGVVDEMLVLEGQRVERGQLVARLVTDDAEIDLAEAEAALATARAELASAEADLAAARTDWEQPVERERAIATADGRLARVDAELAQLPFLIAAEEAARASLADEAARAREAERAGAATEIEVIILEKQVEARAATIAALEKREQILAAQADVERADRDAARRNLELRVDERRALDAAAAAVARREAAVRGAEAHLARAALTLDRMTIRAPITGYVQRRLKAPGDKVMLGMDDPHSAHLVHLYDPADIQVRVDVPLADAANLFVGQACEVVVEVLPGETFRGEVTRITHEADLQKNTLQAKVRVIDPSPLLRPEMLTRVTFRPERAESAERAPADESASATDDSAPTSRPSGPVGLRITGDALDRTGDDSGSARVWLVRDRRAGRGTLVPTAVEIVGRDGERSVVAGELRPGDLVADVAAARAAGIDLRPGLRIRMTATGDRS